VGRVKRNPLFDKWWVSLTLRLLRLLRLLPTLRLLGAVDGKRLEYYRQFNQVPPSLLHSPMFYPDIEETLRSGVSTMASAALELLKPE